MALLKSFLSVLFRYRENRPGRNEHDAPGWRNGIPSRGIVSWSDRTGCGRSIGSWPVHVIDRVIASRVADQLARRVASRCALASCCAFAHAQSSPAMRRSRDLGYQFVIRACRARFFLVDFLAYEREPTGKTFRTPLTSPNPNMYVKFIFPWSSPSSGRKKERERERGGGGGGGENQTDRIVCVLKKGQQAQNFMPNNKQSCVAREGEGALLSFLYLLLCYSQIISGVAFPSLKERGLITTTIKVLGVAVAGSPAWSKLLMNKRVWARKWRVTQK